MTQVGNLDRALVAARHRAHWQGSRSLSTAACSVPASPARSSRFRKRACGPLCALLARDDLHVVAVSPAAVCALRESDSVNNPLLMPHYTITVIYQVRTTPAASEQLDPSAVVA
jgi:hypothetical protein